jgi:hypothetical protein
MVLISYGFVRTVTAPACMERLPIGLSIRSVSSADCASLGSCNVTSDSFPAPLRISYSLSAMTNDERMIHQDAFAAEYQEDEYVLLGMEIKYAGLRGREARVIGKNRSDLAGEERVH